MNPTAPPTLPSGQAPGTNSPPSNAHTDGDASIPPQHFDQLRRDNDEKYQENFQKAKELPQKLHPGTLPPHSNLEDVQNPTTFEQLSQTQETMESIPRTPERETREERSGNLARPQNLYRGASDAISDASISPRKSEHHRVGMLGVRIGGRENDSGASGREERNTIAGSSRASWPTGATEKGAPLAEKLTDDPRDGKKKREV